MINQRKAETEMNIFDRPQTEFDQFSNTLNISLRVVLSRIGKAVQDRFRSEYHDELASRCRSDPAVMAAAKAQTQVSPREELARRIKAAQIDVQLAALAVQAAEADPRRLAALDGLRIEQSAASKKVADLEVVAAACDAQSRHDEVKDQLARSEGQAAVEELTQKLAAASTRLDEAIDAAAERLHPHAERGLARSFIAQSKAPGVEVSNARLMLAKAQQDLERAKNDPQVIQLRGALAEAERRLDEATEAAAHADSAGLALAEARDNCSAIMHRLAAELCERYRKEVDAAYAAAVAAIAEPFSRWMIAQRLAQQARLTNPSLAVAESAAKAAIEDISTPKGRKAPAA
jgi:hypothetical protein